MKTKQEQIRAMAQIICDCCDVDGKCWDNHPCINISIQDCNQKEAAERLVQAGYGNISEYKAEIERLKDGYARVQEQLRVQEQFAKYQIVSDKEIKARRKQAKIDILNKVKEKCKFDGHIVAVYKNDIDELIKEVEND